MKGLLLSLPHTLTQVQRPPDFLMLVQGPDVAPKHNAIINSSISHLLEFY